MISNNMMRNKDLISFVFSHLTSFLDIPSECNQLNRSIYMLKKEDYQNQPLYPNRICIEGFLLHLHLEEFMMNQKYCLLLHTLLNPRYPTILALISMGHSQRGHRAFQLIRVIHYLLPSLFRSLSLSL